MKRTILIILAAIFLCGCANKTTADSQAVQNAGGSSETGSEAVTEEASVSTSQENDSTEQVLRYLWKKDITLQDQWTPTQDLSSFPYKEISVPASEAVAIDVTLESAELTSDQPDPPQGGVSSVYAIVNMAETNKEEYRKVWSELKSFNEYAQQNAELEISDGEIRYAAYREEDPGLSYLYLTSWTGIELTRADSGLLSYFRTVYRYNRGLEPDYYEVYGTTIDPDSGRLLTLNDILTDTSGLPQMIWDALVRNGQRSESDPDKDAFIEILGAAIQGCRDDGSFGWALDPLGIEFALVESREDGGKTTHIRERAYIPFNQCSEILRDGIAEPSYDFMTQLSGNDLVALTGEKILPSEENSSYDSFYYVKKSGRSYVYCSAEDHTDVCVTQNNELVRIDGIDAQISTGQYDHMRTCLTPDDYKLYKTVFLLQELFLEVDAHTSEDGVPVTDGYYVPVTNPMPVTTGAAFEAEVFPDEESKESSAQIIEENSTLAIIRSDGETFIDCSIEYGDPVARLYIDGNTDDGWTVNGHPADEVIAHQQWPEE